MKQPKIRIRSEVRTGSWPNCGRVWCYEVPLSDGIAEGEAFTWEYALRVALAWAKTDQVESVEHAA
jgi:hypothetical protein